MGEILEKFEKIEKASHLWLKGYTINQIARELDVTNVTAKGYVDEYKSYISGRIEEDPDFLDRLEDNTIRALDEMNLISKEAWETYERAKQFEMINQQATTLKLAMDIAERKAKLLNLMGMKIDGGNMSKMRKLERVNEIVSLILKEIVADCEHCRVEAQVRLAEAFQLMDRQDQAAEMHALTEGHVVEEAEIVEEEHDMEGMMTDVFGDD